MTGGNDSGTLQLRVSKEGVERNSHITITQKRDLSQTGKKRTKSIFCLSIKENFVLILTELNMLPWEVWLNKGSERFMLWLRGLNQSAFNFTSASKIIWHYMCNSKILLWPSFSAILFRAARIGESKGYKWSCTLKDEVRSCGRWIMAVDLEHPCPNPSDDLVASDLRYVLS